MQTHSGSWLFASTLGLLVLSTLLFSFFQTEQWHTKKLIVRPSKAVTAEGLPPNTMEIEKTTAIIGLSFLGVRADQSELPPHLRSGAGNYFFPFIIISVHLLVVLIGAAYLARTRHPSQNE
ncbi:MAG: NADH-quinone oxidoreductase subunit J [Pirellulaceae bacterium]|nr:NADH-quinone oxidoreductase subunit J [Pirellulaceae bacterium]